MDAFCLTCDEVSSIDLREIEEYLKDEKAVRAYNDCVRFLRERKVTGVYALKSKSEAEKIVSESGAFGANPKILSFAEILSAISARAKKRDQTP